MNDPLGEISNLTGMEHCIFFFVFLLIIENRSKVWKFSIKVIIKKVAVFLVVVNLVDTAK